MSSLKAKSVLTKFNAVGNSKDFFSDAVTWRPVGAGTRFIPIFENKAQIYFLDLWLTQAEQKKYRKNKNGRYE